MLYNSVMGINQNYQTRLTKKLSVLQKDLKYEKITQEEFNILLGLLLKVEMNNFVKSQIKDLDIEDNNRMTFVSYAGTKKFSAI